MKRTPLRNKSKKKSRTDAHDARVKKRMLIDHGYYSQDSGEWCNCYFCGKPVQRPDPCHLKGKNAFPAFRFVIENVVPGHRLCHSAFDQHCHELQDQIENSIDYIDRIELIINGHGTVIQ